MHVIVDVHVHPDDVSVEANESGNGIVLREHGQFVPRINIFLGETRAERRESGDALIAAIMKVMER